MTARGGHSEALFVDRGGFEPRPAESPFVAMQRVVVRMLFDPVFVEQVYANPDAALAGLELDNGLVEQLLTNDRRLWNADRMRRRRALHILIEEFKVASTLAMHEGRSLSLLDAFFSSAPFHQAVQLRGYMAIAYVAYLESLLQAGTLSSPHLVAALRLEAAMARSRRLLRDALRGVDPVAERARARKGSQWLCQPGVLGVFVPSGTIALVQHIETYLFEVSQVPALTLCDDAPRPDPLPALDESTPEAYLLEPQMGGKVELSGVPAEFIHGVQVCEEPRSGVELVSALGQRGIAPQDATDYAEQLLEGGVLRRL